MSDTDLKHAIEPMIERIRAYNPDCDADLLRRVYDFAYEKHAEQKRDDGRPYIIHPIAAAETLIDLRMDDHSVAAALLHDVIEDQDVTLDDLRKLFGDDIAKLVDGVTKLKFTGFDFGGHKEDEDGDKPKKKKANVNKSAENIRKIFLAMAKDFRVMVIKLADRLHNMRTLDALSEERRRRIARETMQIYAPLAHRLGIGAIKWELEDLSFKALEPEAYERVSELVAKSRDEREEDIAEAVDMLERYLKSNHIKATIRSRPKHLWSIHRKMITQHIDFEDIYDLSALRVITDTPDDCYRVLGVVHDLWMPIPNMFSDYIAKPKSNMYQSLHTKVIGPKGEPMEIQIRTWEMHRVADFGVAAHWQYKENLSSQDEFQKKLSWLRQQLFDWQETSHDAGEFLSNVINDLFTDQVFVFTPRGDVIDLPAGSTPVDFAYRIHSDVGNHCVGARVNGKQVPLTYAFSNGDIVEVISRSNAQPSLDWLQFVKSSQARSKIKQFFRKRDVADFAERGRDAYERELVKSGLDTREYMREDKISELAKDLGYEDLYAAIGYGYVSPMTIINHIKDTDTRHLPGAIVKRAHRSLTLSLDGVDTLMITRANCCSPLPGEKVVGYVTRGKGIALHAADCPNIRKFREIEPERLVDITWEEKTDEKYKASIKIHTIDRIGMLSDITAVFSEEKINIVGMNVDCLTDKTAEFTLMIEVVDFDALKLVMDKLDMMKDVLSVERVATNARI